jgi:hypothetical protein
MKRTSIATSILLIALALAVLLTPGPTPAAQAQEPASSQMTVDVVDATYIATATVNSAWPNVDSEGRDVTRSAGWGTVDIFVTGDVSGTATLTATMQVSADGTNWTNANYEYWTGSAIGTKTQQRAISADGTAYMTVPLAGEYWRVSLQTTGGVTTTVKATLRR